MKGSNCQKPNTWILCGSYVTLNNNNCIGENSVTITVRSWWRTHLTLFIPGLGKFARPCLLKNESTTLHFTGCYFFMVLFIAIFFLFEESDGNSCRQNRPWIVEKLHLLSSDCFVLWRYLLTFLGKWIAMLSSKS